MLTLLELGPKQCRFPVTDNSPHYFCGEPTDGRSYCPTHDAKCHAGHGKPWQALAGMMEATEQTVQRLPRTGSSNLDGTFRDYEEARPIDEVLREAETVYDKPGGLMART